MTEHDIRDALEAWSQVADASGPVEVQAACPHDCPDTCAMRVRVDGGRVVAVKGDPTHSLTAGTLCTKVSRYAERSYSPDRLKMPMKRIGNKGEGKFQAITWDEAYAIIGDRLSEVWRRNPQAILPYSYAGTMGAVQGEGMAGRFFHALGASLLDRTVCSAAGVAGMRLSMGGSIGMDSEAIEGARLILLWGTNPITSHVHLWAKIQKAKRAGAILWAIDPYRSDSAEKCHHHIALRPGTDVALAYAIAHVLQRDGLLDDDYIARHTRAADRFLAAAADWSPSRAAEWCGIEAGQVEALAHAYGSIRPAAIRLNYGMQRHASGADAVRAVMALPALAGHWRDASGGAVLSTSGWVPRNPNLARPDLLGQRSPRSINMSAIGAALNTSANPVEALLVYNSNPVAIAPDSNAVRRGFAREDLFTVVLEHFQTDTADYADILLPATTQLEHFDIHSAYGHLHVLLNRPALAPLAQARSNSRIFRELAQLMAMRLGEECAALGDPALAAGDAEVAFDAFEWTHPAFADDVIPRLLRQGHSRLNAARGAPFAAGGFRTEDGRFCFANDSVPQPLPQVRPNHEDWRSARAARYPLQAISPPPRHLLNSSFANVASLRDLNGPPSVLIHPQDASARGIQTGQAVRVFNDRGGHQVRAEVSDRARPGVVVVFSVFWHKDMPDGNNVNVLTSQALSDHGGGATFYDCLVDIEAVAASG
ncbi:MAG: molybdopterin oxidoreductase family protein [Burkholderiaceae bacterium]|nr:molybdopterin oxidoreductase family protein [Sulfuritalea sp.]MCF8174350.1 molybdopterin oxidoreductase family protein [Burkholderiaceae bacterium]